MRERDDWEKEHPSMARHGRQPSGLSTLPLLKDQDGSASPTTVEHRSSTFTLVQDGRPRQQSGISDLNFATPGEDEVVPVTRSMQNPGALPALDLGIGIQEDVPHSFIAEEQQRKKDPTPSESEELKRKEDLLLEIQTIRRSIDALKADTPPPSSSSHSRRPSMTSRRTLSMDANSALLPAPAHLRPPRESDPRARAHSIEMSVLEHSRLLEEPIHRPTSAPLRDEDWDSYVHDRKLLQPPSGVTPPIKTTPIDNSNRIAMPQAVTDALSKRKRREGALGPGEQTIDLSDDVPLAKMNRHKRSFSGGNIPVTILPPRRTSAIVSPTPQRPAPTRVRTFEELNERHREKMKDLQAPLTQAGKDEAELRAARQRWERSKALEKEAVTRRQAEKVADLEKRKRSEDEPPVRQSSERRRHSRSMSADRLAGLSSPSKRLSTLKVEDWQRYQREAANPERAPGSASKRNARALKSEGVPFPDRGRRSPEEGHRIT
jgi:hypothetical protein